MTLFLLATAAFFAAVAGTSVLVARSLSRKLKSAEAALGRVGERVERLNRALEQGKKIGEAADAKRAELAATDDGNLVGRANDLFGG